MTTDNGSPENIEEELRSLKGIVSVAQVVVSSLELDEVLQNILYSAMATMGMPAGSIALFEEKFSELSLHAHAGLSLNFVSRQRWKVKAGGLTHRILEEGELFVVEDTGDAAFFNNPLAVAEGIRSLIAVPLKYQEKIVGILYLNDFSPRTFSEMRLSQLGILASFATMSIDNARLHEATRLLACTDGLTGLYNHRQFTQLYAREVSRAERYGTPLSLVMMDVDNFKKFNDTYGHPAGDQVLITVGEILRKTLREVDLPCRYGGEEFIALLPETDLEAALLVAERVRHGIERHATRGLAETVTDPVTVSIGVATYPQDGTDLETLLKLVDTLLYKAKNEGKNQVYHAAQGE